MPRPGTPLSLKLAYSSPDARKSTGRAAARADRQPKRRGRRSRVPPRTIGAVVLGALAWLLLGCSGLLWIIAFTRDAHSLAVALAVWVLAFVGPSVLATAAAYRLDEAQGHEASAAGD